MASWLSKPPPETIDSDDIRLRRLQAGDARLLTDLIDANLHHLRPWVPWAREDAGYEARLSFLRKAETQWSELEDFHFLVTLSTNEAIGGAGLHTRQGPTRQGPPTLEIGYWIAASHANRGYATAAARSLTSEAMLLPGVERVEIRCDAANHASAAVPRKLGFQLVTQLPRDSVAPGGSGTTLVWAVTREQWLAQ
jgi:RimJ/RimL family protein N-acetyltransferase